MAAIRTASCVGVDMESATIAANGFRYRIRVMVRSGPEAFSVYERLGFE